MSGKLIHPLNFTTLPANLWFVRRDDEDLRSHKKAGGRRRKTEAKVDGGQERGWMTGTKGEVEYQRPYRGVKEEIRPIKFRSMRRREKEKREKGGRRRGIRNQIAERRIEKKQSSRGFNDGSFDSQVCWLTSPQKGFDANSDHQILIKEDRRWDWYIPKIAIISADWVDWFILKRHIMLWIFWYVIW